MTKLMTLVGTGALLWQSAALAGTCKIHSASAPGHWRFFRVYDAHTGEVLLRQAVNGGDSKAVTSKHNQVRIESKLPGHRNYRPGPLAACKGDNTISV
jgi:hypothetical protein